MKKLLTVACIAIAASLTHAQIAPVALPRVAPTVDQILSLKRAGSPEISPDNHSVAYTIRYHRLGRQCVHHRNMDRGRPHRNNPPADRRQEIELFARLVA